MSWNVKSFQFGNMFGLFVMWKCSSRGCRVRAGRKVRELKNPAGRWEFVSCVKGAGPSGIRCLGVHSSWVTVLIIWYIPFKQKECTFLCVGLYCSNYSPLPQVVDTFSHWAWPCNLHIPCDLHSEMFKKVLEAWAHSDSMVEYSHADPWGTWDLNEKHTFLDLEVSIFFL